MPSRFCCHGPHRDSSQVHGHAGRHSLRKQTFAGELKMKRTIAVISMFIALLATDLAAQENQRAASPPFDITVQRLSPRVAVFYGDPWDNAIVAVATQKGIVVVDAPFSKTISKGFRDAIQAEFKRSDFAYLINTHEHVCHVGGNEAYADLPIVGHESLRREMLASMNDSQRVANVQGIGEREVTQVRERLRRTDPKQLESHAFASYEKGWQIIQEDYRGNPAVVPPTITFDRDMTLHLGDVTVRLMYYGFAHGIADIVIAIPEENLILTGGVLYPDKVPVTGKVTEKATPAIVDNWLVVMHGLVDSANDSTRFLRSHGRTVMKKEQHQRFVSYLEQLWNKLRRAKASGETLEQVKAETPLKDFPEVAKLPNESLRGTEWEILDIHQQNIEHLWKVLVG
jgi:glyoxylase-like metal-dependent hydrolase (beta-lactamase superfamily II)